MHKLPEILVQSEKWVQGFEEDQTQERLFANLAARKDIYAKKTVVLVVHGITKEAAETVKNLEQNGVGVVIYNISANTDIKEVL